MKGISVVNAEQFILLTYSLPVHEINGTVPITWEIQGVFANQTEIVKWMMMSNVGFHDYKIVKTSLPLLLRPDHDTVELDELTEDAECVELEDEQPTDEKTP